MQRQSVNGLVFYRFNSLGGFDGLVQAVFTRLGGVSRPPFDSLNVGHTVGDDLEAVEANHRLIFRTLGISPHQTVTSYLVHSTRVAVVDKLHLGKVIPATDGLVTNVPGVFLILRFADCVPIILYDPEERAVGLIHAGWKGSILGIAAEAVRTMVQAFGSHPEDIVAGIGPSIGPCCYEVGEEVVELAQEHLASPPLVKGSNGAVHLDLWELNRRYLAEAGVKQVEVAQICTACHRDEFFSHRASRGRTGRFAVIVGIR
ncbi:MAG: peptidoglycan editing factor PgeF [Chloroflexi bacterium]|nr:MAG: peptidoglycan editing factor PgeF [Chloroflexota bacterium]HDN79813.1 peptidoglycan editing factor PgeF [Chloroflexota bacterium]